MDEDQDIEQSVYKENVECTMIEINQTRRLFTQKKYLPYLVEFAKSYPADLLVVKAEKAEILPLKLLVQKINNPEYSSDSKFEVISEFRFVKQTEDVELKPDGKTQIVKTIYSLFLKGEVVSIKRLKEEFPDEKQNSLRHCLANAKNLLFIDGYDIEEVGRGRYATHEDVKEMQSKTTIVGSHTEAV